MRNYNLISRKACSEVDITIGTPTILWEALPYLLGPMSLLRQRNTYPNLMTTILANNRFAFEWWFTLTWGVGTTA